VLKTGYSSGRSVDHDTIQTKVLLPGNHGVVLFAVVAPTGALHAQDSAKPAAERPARPSMRETRLRDRKR